MKRSGRDEPTWIVIHIYMETAQGISLYSCLHLKLTKILCFSFLSYMFFHQQNQRSRGQNKFCPQAGGGGGKVSQIMYTHVSKCKDDKIKFKK
jgi:hypothetical protein